MKFIKLFPFELIADTLVERECIYINVEKIVSVDVYSNVFDEFRNAFEINNPRHEVLYYKAKNLNDFIYYFLNQNKVIKREMDNVKRLE